MLGAGSDRLPAQALRLAIAALFLLILTGGAANLQAQSPPASQTREARILALVGANVLQPDFTTLAPNQTLLIKGARILEVGPRDSLAVPAGAEVIDITGKTVIPGLWDAHIHSRYRGIDHMRLLIAHGITSTRDLGGPWEHLARLRRWREAITAGGMVGPRIWTAGTVLDNPGARWSHITVVHDPDEARAAVQRLKREGADFVKVYSNLTPENYDAIIAEAGRLGLPVDGHVPRAISPERASRSGQRILEHAGEVALALAPGTIPHLANGRIDWRALDGALSPEKADALAATFRTNGTALDPTLNLRRHFIALTRKEPAVLANPALRFIPAPYLAAWRTAPERTADLAQWEANRNVEGQALAMLFRRGVPILAGTDTVKPYFVPGDALHDELAALVEAGLPPGEALRAATRTPAKVMGLTDLGLVAPGFLADLLVLDANPLEDISHTRDIAMVLANGRLFDGPALEALHEDIAAKAAQWNEEPTGR